MKLETLERLGLSEKAAKVYLAALSLGTATIQDLAHKANIKRPTAYLHVEELLNEGLLKKFPSGKKEYFQAAAPETLKKRAEQQLATVEQLLPELQQLHATVKGRPRISILEGQKALRQIYKDITKANNIRFWSDLEVVETDFKDVFTDIAESINRNQIRCRELLRDTPETKKSSKQFAAIAGKTYSSRIATTQYPIYNDNVIYDDVVVLFSIYRYNLFAVQIHEPTIAATLKSLFDLAWESAEPFIGR